MIKIQVIDSLSKNLVDVKEVEDGTLIGNFLLQYFGESRKIEDHVICYRPEDGERVIANMRKKLEHHSRLIISSNKVI